MALSKKETIEYEIRGEFKTILKRIRLFILEDNIEVSTSHRVESFMCDADVSGESAELQALAGALWTDAVKEAYEASKS